MLMHGALSLTIYYFKKSVPAPEYGCIRFWRSCFNRRAVLLKLPIRGGNEEPPPHAFPDDLMHQWTRPLAVSNAHQWDDWGAPNGAEPCFTPHEKGP